MHSVYYPNLIRLTEKKKDIKQIFIAGYIVTSQEQQRQKKWEKLTQFINASGGKKRETKQKKKSTLQQ